LREGFDFISAWNKTIFVYYDAYCRTAVLKHTFKLITDAVIWILKKYSAVTIADFDFFVAEYTIKE